MAQKRKRRRKYDFAGQHIGYLTCIKPVETKYPGVTGWLCVCECGTECVKTTQQLASVLRGEHRSIACGCNRSRGVDLTGARFGRLVVIERAADKGNAKWRCRCDCGSECIAYANPLISGRKNSCGCLERENRLNLWERKNNGLYGTYGERSRRYNERLYNIWNGMKTRCYNSKSRSYKNYGARGISVCEEWKHNFPAFQKWAVENGYDENAPFGECTIDRIDVNGNYEPSNCRWVSMEIQRTNKR
jgi:hypothetical protein